MQRRTTRALRSCPTRRSSDLGISYLNRGQEYNFGQTRLIWDEAWSTAHKIGRSDEYRQFRRLFHDRYLFAESDNVKDHRDRKSTRLNSSHLGISYAVFCLKKK